jgi:uncharacterized DUF497 family protein
VKIEFDPRKSQKNAAERGLPFELVSAFDWETALAVPDNRYAYPEARFVATGFIGNRLHVVCFTPVTGGIRVISFRKANNKEIKRHGEKASDQQER